MVSSSEQVEDKHAQSVINAIKRAVTSQRPGRKMQKQKFQRITLEPEDATWISSLLYEECNRGLIEVEIQAKPGPHSISWEFLLVIAPVIVGPIGNRLIDILEKKVREYFSKKAEKKRNTRMNGVY